MRVVATMSRICGMFLLSAKAMYSLANFCSINQNLTGQSRGIPEVGLPAFPAQLILPEVRTSPQRE